MSSQFDVVIVGGGLVGATLALLLVRSAKLPPQSICVLEQAPPTLWSARAAPDLRVLALSRASQSILGTVGVWERVAAARAYPYERVQVWHASEPPRGAGALCFDAAEVGQANLGHIVENSLLLRELQRELVAHGIEQRHVSLDALTVDAEALRLNTGADQISTRLLVGADGACSAVRRLAGLWMNSEDYGQRGVVANIRCELSHDSTAWQRFLGDGTLALLPLASGECSVVWSVASARAAELVSMPAADFNHALTAASDGVLGTLALASERLSFPLRRMSALKYVLERCALIGDAAHVVHPLAGQGANLGLLDAAALADVLASGIAEREDLGALRLLRAYERWRKSENEIMSRAFDAFNALLSTGDGRVARLTRRGMGLVGRSATLRRLFMQRALGTSGELPKSARQPAVSGQLGSGDLP